jgi:hypothetical protein
MEGVQPCAGHDGAFYSHAVERKVILFANANCPSHHLLLFILEVAEGRVRFGELLQCCGVKSQSLLTFSNDLRLFLQESSRSSLPPRLGLSNRALVSVEDGKRGRDSNREEVVLLFVRVTRSDYKIGILLGDFQLQVGFCCAVLCEGATNIKAIQNGIPLELLR